MRSENLKLFTLGIFMSACSHSSQAPEINREVPEMPAPSSASMYTPHLDMVMMIRVDGEVRSMATKEPLEDATVSIFANTRAGRLEPEGVEGHQTTSETGGFDFSAYFMWGEPYTKELPQGVEARDSDEVVCEVSIESEGYKAKRYSFGVRDLDRLAPAASALHMGTVYLEEILRKNREGCGA